MDFYSYSNRPFTRPCALGTMKHRFLTSISWDIYKYYSSFDFVCLFDGDISVISWWSVLLVEDRRKPPTCHKSLANCIT